ncbi:MAG: mycofactocin biosynthesis peptidyl-dipeptidase MftE [Actinomycetes bacterium]
MVGESIRAPRRLADATTKEAERWGPVLLMIPLGSTEQHGPHLPLSTDSMVAEALCSRLADRRPDLVLAPTLAFGASGEHQGFAGTLSIGTEVLARVITELVRSARGSVAGVVVVNAHGGNAEALRSASATASTDGDDLLVLSAHFPEADAHAGRTETSLLLALAPSLVRQDEAMAGNTAPLSEIAHDLRHGGVRAVSPTGVLGDPAGASAQEGEVLLAGAVDRLLGSIDERFPR